MSEENLAAFRRAVDAINRRDIGVFLGECDPDVVYLDAISQMFGGQESLYRGHDAVRDLYEDLFGSFALLKLRYPDVRDRGRKLVALGYLEARGKESGAEAESPVAAVVEFEGQKATRVWTYLDHREALEAVGLSE